MPRRYVLERMGFEDHERNETKKINLRTHHGMDFEVNLYNSESVSHFGCPGWEALCKMYDFQEGMFVTMDLGDPDIDQDNLFGSLLIRFQFYRYVSSSNIVIK